MSKRTMERRRLAAYPLDMLRRISISRILRAAVEREHVVALSLYFVLAIAFSWPLVQGFTTRVIGEVGNADVRHSTWILWHYQQWAMGQDSLLSSSLLYTPRGISMLVDGVGPLSGFIGLPLWSWGPEATYNGTILIGLWLSGYCMFLLARSLKLAPSVALFAGLFFLLSPIHEVALLAHMEKTFTGLLPLTLLAINKTLNPRASQWWAAATGVTILLAGLYSGYQFVFAALGVGFFALTGLLRAPLGDRVAVIRRLAVALKHKSAFPRRWLVFAVFCTVLAVGPVLRFLDRTGFTLLGLPLSMPFAMMSGIPGLDFMRVPGRLMMVAAVGWGISAGFGLDWLMRRLPRHQYWVATGVVAFLLVEGFPSAWPSSPLPQVPNFYKQLAQDRAHFAVLDLPVAEESEGSDYTNWASTYQMYQLTHHKAIAWGYLSHVYTQHPLTTLDRLSQKADLTIDGRVPDFGALYDLSQAGYRYVVWHKTLPEKGKESANYRLTPSIIQSLFGRSAKPFYEDDQVRVYQVPARVSAAAKVNLDTSTWIEYGDNWLFADPPWRWAKSPATLIVNSPRAQAAQLQIFPGVMFDPDSADSTGMGGVLDVKVGDLPVVSTHLSTGQLTSVPITLSSGRQIVTLSLQAGNFDLSNFHPTDHRVVSFSIVIINLQLSPPH